MAEQLHTQIDAYLTLERKKQTLSEDYSPEDALALLPILEDARLSPKRRLDLFNSVDQAKKILKEADVDLRQFVIETLDVFSRDDE